MMKIELLLAVAATASRDLAITSVLAGLRGARVTVHDPSLLAGLAHGEETESAPPFQYLVELACGSTRSATDVLAAARIRLNAIDGIDRPASTAVAGPEFTVVPGDQPIMLGMALTRRAGMSRDEFTQYWRTTHAELGRQVPGSEGYRQVHLDETLTNTARDTFEFGGPRFDGMAVAFYSSQAALEAIFSNSDVTSTLLADERNFIDHARSAMVVGRAPATALRN
jgi:uncharacterized protein (TIGR02118 family)